MQIGIKKPGELLAGLTPFNPLSKWLLSGINRHCGLWFNGNILHAFYIRVGDSPKRTSYTSIDLNDENWKNWKASKSLNEVHRPK